MHVEMALPRECCLGELEAKLNAVMGTSHSIEFMRLTPRSSWGMFHHEKPYDKRCSVVKASKLNMLAVISPRRDWKDQFETGLSPWRN